MMKKKEWSYRKKATSQPPWNFVAAFFFVFRPFARRWMLLERRVCLGLPTALGAGGIP